MNDVDKHGNTLGERYQRIIDDFYTSLPPLHITLRELEALADYSATLPTGTTPGKRWRSEHGWQFIKYDPQIKARWIVGEYDPTDDGKSPSIQINWYRPVIRVAAKSFRTEPKPKTKFTGFPERSEVHDMVNTAIQAYHGEFMDNIDPRYSRG